MRQDVVGFTETNLATLPFVFSAFTLDYAPYKLIIEFLCFSSWYSCFHPLKSSVKTRSRYIPLALIPSDFSFIFISYFNAHLKSNGDKASPSFGTFSI
jgi:hypothetical protein